MLNTFSVRIGSLSTEAIYFALQLVSLLHEFCSRSLELLNSF